MKSYILSDLSDRKAVSDVSYFQFESLILESVSIVNHQFMDIVKKLLNKEPFILAILKKYHYLCNSGYHISRPSAKLVCSVAC